MNRYIILLPNNNRNVETMDLLDAYLNTKDFKFLKDLKANNKIIVHKLDKGERITKVLKNYDNVSYMVIATKHEI